MPEMEMSKKTEAKRTIILVAICAMIIIVVLWNISNKTTTEIEIGLEYTCTNYTTETFHEFRKEIPCYLTVGNETYDGMCIEVGEHRNATMSHMTCICETENRTEGLYAWGGPEAYPYDLYWNYTIMSCDTSTITGPESKDLEEKFGEFVVNETQWYVECPWDNQYDCRLQLAKQEMSEK